MCGNVNICLVKLDVGEYDVIILVFVGFICFEMEFCICMLLFVDILLFVVG